MWCGIHNEHHHGVIRKIACHCGGKLKEVVKEIKTLKPSEQKWAKVWYHSYIANEERRIRL